MDPELKTLEEKIDKIGKMSEDTNRIVHGMRNSARLGRLAKFVWWLAVLVLSAAVYYFYLQPYLLQLQQIYSQFQGGATQAQSYQEQFADFLNQFRSTPQ